MAIMTSHRMSELGKDTLLAAGGILGAVAASSCCLLPLTFAAAGVGGAWLGTLIALRLISPSFS